MALPSNSNNNKDAVVGLVLIVLIIIGISAVVLYFIPNDEGSTPDQTSMPEPTSTNTCYLFCDSTGYEPQWAKSANSDAAVRACTNVIPFNNSNDSLWCDEFFEYYLLGVTEFDLNNKNESTKTDLTVEESATFTVESFSKIETAYQNIYQHCSMVSNYEEYYEFGLIIQDISPQLQKITEITTELVDKIKLHGLDGNIEVVLAANAVSDIAELVGNCIQDLAHTYK